MISLSIFSFTWVIDLIYLKLPLFGMTCVSILTFTSTTFDVSLNFPSMLFVLILLNLKPLGFSVHLQSSSLSLTSPHVSSINTMSFSNNLNHGRSLLIYRVNSLITMTNKSGLIVNLRYNPISTQKCFEFCLTVLTQVLSSSYISLVT